VRALVCAAAFLVSCAPEPTGYYLARARDAYAAGDFERALGYTETALQQQPYETGSEEIALHLAALRRLERHEEADAFEDFATRYAAGEPTDTTDTTPSPDECQELDRKRAQTTRLIREYGPLPLRGHFDTGALAATYAVDAEGRPVRIRVLRARHPASAWLIIQSIAGAKVSPTRLAHAGEAFPIAHCAYWDPLPRRVFIPPRMYR